MTTTFIEKIVGDLGDLGDKRQDKARAFLRDYSDGQWINKERGRLVTAIERAEAQDGGTRS